MSAWERIEPDHFAGGLYAWVHKDSLSTVEVYGRRASEGAGVLISSHLFSDREFIKAKNGKEALAKARYFMRKHKGG